MPQGNNQLDAAMEHLKALGAEPLDVAAFEDASGVGVEVSPAEVAAAVAEVVSGSEAALREQRYLLNTTILLAQAGLLRLGPAHPFHASRISALHCHGCVLPLPCGGLQRLPRLARRLEAVHPHPCRRSAGRCTHLYQKKQQSCRHDISKSRVTVPRTKQSRELPAVLQARERIRWAEVRAVKAELDAQVAALLGPKTDADVAAAAAPKKKVRATRVF